ncbi:hypothetical protein MTO96_007950 [Rhipicephalus appendiculatus]
MDSTVDESGIDSPSDASFVDQSSLEVPTLTGTSGGDEREREGVSAITLIACVFCAVACLLGLVLVLLFSSDLELYGGDDDSDGESDDEKFPTRYPPGSRSGSPPPVPVTAPPPPMTTKRRPSPPPPATTALVTTTTKKRTTKRPPPPPPAIYTSPGQNDYDKENDQAAPSTAPNDYDKENDQAAPLLHPPTTTTKKTTKRPPPPPNDYDKENDQAAPSTTANDYDEESDQAPSTTPQRLRQRKRPSGPLHHPPTTTTKKTTRRPPPPTYDYDKENDQAAPLHHPPTTTTKKTTKRPPPTLPTTTTKKTTKRPPSTTATIYTSPSQNNYDKDNDQATRATANNKNPLVKNWDYDVYSILSKAQKTDRTKTQFGLGFAYEHRRNLTNDLVNHSLEVFWEHNVFHFGILDCPGRHFSLEDMDEAFVALKALDASVQKARASGNTSYIVLGAVANYDKWYDYFESKFSSYFKPDLFISVAGPFCGAILGGIAIFAPCLSHTPPPYFGSYTDVCNTPPFSSNFRFDAHHSAMLTFDPGHSQRRMFVYENEKSLCRKLCLAKANITKLEFGVAIYDLDYEDTDNTCADQNAKGAYSRLQTVSTVLKFLVSKFTDPSKLDECSRLSG